MKIPLSGDWTQLLTWLHVACGNVGTQTTIFQFDVNFFSKFEPLKILCSIFDILQV